MYCINFVVITNIMKFVLQETVISSLVFPKFPPHAINVFLAFIIALICVSELTLVSSKLFSIAEDLQ